PLTAGNRYFQTQSATGVNKQNFRYWAPNNPRQIHKQSLHSERVTVWCAVADFGVISPYFFEENGKAVTVTSACYVDMLRNFLQPKLYEHRNLAVWFQQDGATAHTAGISMDLLLVHSTKAKNRRIEKKWCSFEIWHSCWG
ncbi:hypothetical protein AVEN_65611-1, partial [Araneus ventricosus]